MPGLSGSGPRSRRLVVGVAALGLVTAVLLIRPDTAATDADLSGATPATSPSGVPGDDVPTVSEIRAAPVFGLRLTDTDAAAEALGYRIGPMVGGCRAVLPGGPSPGPTQGFTAWSVGGRVVSLALQQAADSDSPLGTLLGRRLVALATVEGSATGAIQAQVGWQATPVVVPVVTMTADEATVTAADLDGDADIDHVEVGLSAGDDCDEATMAARVPARTLGPAGWGAVPLGASEATVAGEFVTSRAEMDVLRRDPDSGAVTRRCRTLLVQSPPGPVSILLVDDAVRAIAIDAGETAAGLRIGGTPEDVRRAYPEITAAYVSSRWEQGAAVDWQFPAGDLRIFGGPPTAPVPGLDATLDGPGYVARRIEVGGRC